MKLSEIIFLGPEVATGKMLTYFYYSDKTENYFSPLQLFLGTQVELTPCAHC